MTRLIRVFAGRICHFVGFVMRRLILAIFHRSEQRVGPENLMKNIITPKKMADNLLYGISIENTVTFDKSGFSEKEGYAFLSCTIRCSKLFVVFKENFQCMANRLKLISLKQTR